MVEALLAVLVALAVAFLFGEICHRIGIARVVGQLLGGVFLALPFVRQWIPLDEPNGWLTALAAVGSVLLFFFVGLEINLRDFQKNLKPAFFVSAFNTLIPLLGGFALMRFLGAPLEAAVVVGLALAVSSVSASVDFLEELGLLKSKVGQFIITSGTVDDVLELALTGAVLAFLHTSLRAEGSPGLLAGILTFIFLLAIFRAWLVPMALVFFEQSNNRTAILTGALVITLLMAYLGEFLGVGALIGAFLAGVLIRHQLHVEHRKPWEEHLLTQNIHALAFGFFVPILFVSIGYQVDPIVALENAPLGLALTGIAVGGTILGAVLGVTLSGGSAKEGFIVGWGVSSKGDVELVIASLALGAGLIGSAVFNALIFMSLATTVVSPVAFRHFVRVHHRKFKRKPKGATPVLARK